SAEAVGKIVRKLTPDVGGDVVQRSRVPRIRCDFVLDVIVPQRDVGPLVEMQLAAVDGGAAVLHAGPIEGGHALDLTLQDQHRSVLVTFRPEYRPLGSG